MKTTLYIARHGETQWNKVQRFQGQLNSELTQQGKEQSINIANTLIGNKVDAIFSSNLGRAIQSANICQEILKVNMHIVPQITERHLGAWQGEKIEALTHNVNYNELLHQFTQLKPEGGESAISCGQRIYNALTDAIKEHMLNEVLVIFHGEALRCFLGLLGKESSNNAYDLFKNGSITKVIYDHNTSRFTL